MSLDKIFITKPRNIAYHCWIERWLAEDSQMTSARFVEAMRNNIKKNRERGTKK